MGNGYILLDKKTFPRITSSQISHCSGFYQLRLICVPTPLLQGKRFPAICNFGHKRAMPTRRRGWLLHRQPVVTALYVYINILSQGGQYYCLVSNNPKVSCLIFISIRLLVGILEGMIFIQGCRLKLSWLPYQGEGNMKQCAMIPKGFWLQLLSSHLVTFIVQWKSHDHT